MAYPKIQATPANPKPAYAPSPVSSRPLLTRRPRPRPGASARPAVTREPLTAGPPQFGCSLRCRLHWSAGSLSSAALLAARHQLRPAGSTGTPARRAGRWTPPTGYRSLQCRRRRPAPRGCRPIRSSTATPWDRSNSAKGGKQCYKSNTTLAAYSILLSITNK